MKFFKHGGGRHLGFVRIVNSAVRSAVPENPTLEPSGSDHPLQRYGHSRMLGAYMEPPCLGEGELVGVSDGTIRKSDGSFLYIGSPL